MDPRSRPPTPPYSWLPRARGDGPKALSCSSVFVLGSPAHAGMDLRSPASSIRRSRLPRARGDGPMSYCPRCLMRKAPPRTRGWTQIGNTLTFDSDGSPAHAGMDLRRGKPQDICIRLPRARGDGPFSRNTSQNLTPAPPRTRGWTLAHAIYGVNHDGSPAHAGMDRRQKRAGD